VKGSARGALILTFPSARVSRGLAGPNPRTAESPDPTPLWPAALALTGLLGFLAAHLALSTGAVGLIPYACCVLTSLALYGAATAMNGRLSRP